MIDSTQKQDSLEMRLTRLEDNVFFLRAETGELKISVGQLRNMLMGAVGILALELLLQLLKL